MDGEKRHALGMMLFFIGGAGFVWVALTMVLAVVGASGVGDWLERVRTVGGPPGLFAVATTSAGWALRRRG